MIKWNINDNLILSLIRTYHIFFLKPVLSTVVFASLSTKADGTINMLYVLLIHLFIFGKMWCAGLHIISISTLAIKYCGIISDYKKHRIFELVGIREKNQI